MKKNLFVEEKIETEIMNNAVEAHTPNIAQDDLIEGKVLAIEKSAVYIDVAPYGTGIIYGAEFLQARDVIKKINIGDTVKAKAVDLENKNGYIELSLKEAKQAIVWSEAEESIKNRKTLNLIVKDANKGGLVIDWQGIQGFLPASQLSTENYPKVDDGDKDKILKELKNFIGKSLAVTILSANSKEGKLIFTQKENNNANNSFVSENAKPSNKKYTVGQIIDGTITGVVEFGIFIKLDDGTEGLVHISEISWSLIENPKSIYKTGERVKTKIIDTKDGKVSLSIKALTENPWFEASNRYKKGDKISGVVIKFNKYGALISVEEGVAGLMHISEFGSEEAMKKALSLGKICHCFISVFDPKEERMTLTLKENK